MIKNIVWDLSGTLFRPNIGSYPEDAKKHLSLLNYMWGGTKTASPLDLSAITVLTKSHVKPWHSKEKILLHTGKPVPPIICYWLTGSLSSEKALQLSLNQLKIETNYSSVTKQIIKKMLEDLFDPYTLATCMQPIQPMVKILSECASSKKYSLYLLSNWDIESFNILSQSTHGKQVLQYFNQNNTVISGFVDYLKPQHQIFEYFINHYQINPKETVFIDDQIENIEKAEEYGITAIHFMNNDADSIEKELKHLKIL